MKTEFEVGYAALNEAQKRAVDVIDGPLLVIAGPGTGKTQLLSLRVANILRKTDVSPGNILCLTFTESAQANMQARLTKLIGPAASQVAVHTFHSFGSHIIGTHGDHFQEAFGFRPSDDVTRYQLLANILERLPRDIKLSGMYDGQFFYLKDIQSRISQLKQAGMSPEDLEIQVKADSKWLKQATKILQENLSGFSRLSAKEISRFEALLTDLNDLQATSAQSLLPLGRLATAELEIALVESEGKVTKPITTWKDRWLTKNGAGDMIFKAERQLSKLAELATVYKAYQASLSTLRQYDYDDMIVRVIEQLESSADLRAELQEQYQYILVDEYQDTNGAQSRLLNLLADNPINEGQPNLMVVGDDDQAVYGFQGAYQSNVTEFMAQWPTAGHEVLTVNYRSNAPILNLARQLIVQGEDRLENTYPKLNKELSANDTSKAEQPHLELLPSEVEQFGWLAEQIKADVKNGQDPRQIAVIAPKHKYLEALVPYLQDQGIAVAYERREDILQQPHVVQLLTLAKVIVHLSHGEIQQANQYFPELLSYPWWGINSGWLWEIAVAAQKSRDPWLEIMRASEHTKLVTIANWLLEQAKASQTTPLEPMMDILMGPAEPEKHYASPYRHYYFGGDSIDASVTYLQLLSGLISLRTGLRQYRPDTASSLGDFIAFTDLRLQANLPLRNDHPLVLDTSAIQLLTAHKSKGLEFEQVYLICADEHTWRKERGRSSNIALPPNYAVIAPSGDSPDEKLRLFYVAATRARQQLTLVSYATTNEGKPTIPLGWLQPPEAAATIATIEPDKHSKQSTEQQVRELGFDWLTPHFEIRTQAPWQALLQTNMERYQLSATHMTAFLDVARGGPKAFLINQLLRFPQGLSLSAQFGNVMHSLLERLHGHYNGSGGLPVMSTAQTWLDAIITEYYFGPIEEPKAQRRGRLSLDAIYEQFASNFAPGQKSEYNFAGEGVVIGNARLKGKIDVLQLDTEHKTAYIMDYKTGSILNKWVPPTTNNYEAYKAHRYRQQLMFYKLLVEGSRSFKDYSASHGALLFVEPDEEGHLHKLELTYDDTELERFARLMQAVYTRIIALDLPDTSQYPSDFSGTLAFENYLLGE